MNGNSSTADTIEKAKVVRLFDDRTAGPDLTAALVPGNTLQLHTVENSARQFAVQERFDRMCSDILWGTEDERKFVEMLRGLVETFLPETRYHLQLLKNIASLTWQLERIEKIRHNLFENGNERIGKFGLPQATHDAMSLQGQASTLLRDLQLAIRTYKGVRGSS